MNYFFVHYSFKTLEDIRAEGHTTMSTPACYLNQAKTLELLSKSTEHLAKIPLKNFVINNIIRLTEEEHICFNYIDTEL